MRKRREISFFIIWVLCPLGILFYQNCTPSQLSNQEPRITPLVQQSAQNLTLPQ